jgi:hypothetical protein
VDEATGSTLVPDAFSCAEPATTTNKQAINASNTFIAASWFESGRIIPLGRGVTLPGAFKM